MQFRSKRLTNISLHRWPRWILPPPCKGGVRSYFRCEETRANQRIALFQSIWQVSRRIQIWSQVSLLRMPTLLPHDPMTWATRKAWRRWRRDTAQSIKEGSAGHETWRAGRCDGGGGWELSFRAPAALGSMGHRNGQAQLAVVHIGLELRSGVGSQDDFEKRCGGSTKDNIYLLPDFVRG